MHIRAAGVRAGVLFALIVAVCLQSGCSLGNRNRSASTIQFASTPVKQTSGLISSSSVSRSEIERTKSPTSEAISNSNVKLVGFQQIEESNSPSKASDTDDESDTSEPSDQEKTNDSSVDSNASTSPSISIAGPSKPNWLLLQQVLTSVTNCYPEIEIAIGEIESARGKALASWGEFDSVFAAHSISKPLGFYQTYRNEAGVTRPLYGGGEVYGIYRIGDGNFAPWYGERETNDGGELKAGFSVPLLKDRNIDKRRTAVRSAKLDQNQLEANVEARLLQFERFATQAYWDWVASGQAVRIQQQLLSLAEQRVEQISIRIEKGDLAQISKIDNDRFIAKRKNGLIKARRGLEKAAIKLSLFNRDGNCLPVIADVSQLPNQFPVATSISRSQSDVDIESALQSRPELIELAAAREQACVQVRYAQNLLLPKLDVKGFAGQDLGGAASSKRDKTPFELQLGVFAEVPIQRREGAGKIQAAQGKITQIDAKRRFVSDKIRAEILDAASAVNAAAAQIEQSEENVRLNERSLELGRLSFEEGDIDLLALNIYESSIADARLQLLEAQFKYFFSFAAYETITRSEAFENSDRTNE